MRKRFKIILRHAIIVVTALCLPLTGVAVEALSGNDPLVTISQEAAAPVAVSTKVDDYRVYLEQSPAEDYGGEPLTLPVCDALTAPLCDYQGQREVLLLQTEGGTIEWRVEITEAAYYRLAVTYFAVPSSEQPLNVSVAVNDQVPYAMADGLTLARLWKNADTVFEDANGNQSSPNQVQAGIWTTQLLYDNEGLQQSPLKFLLREGSNTVRLTFSSGGLAVAGIRLQGYDEPESYADKAADGPEKSPYCGEPIVIQGEDAELKTSKELRPQADMSDPSVYPADAYRIKLNYIGGVNWNNTGEALQWTVDIPQSGLYAISFKFRQSYLTNASAIRELTVDGVVPFRELQDIRFPYTLSWKLKTVCDENGDACLVYLSEGEHTFELKVVLAEVADITEKLNEIVYQVGALYRKMIMITGTSPDLTRDYRLYDQIPGLMDNLEFCHTQLVALADRYDALSSVSGGSNAATVRNLAGVLQRMMKSKFRVHEYIADLYSNYCSVGAWVYEMRKMPLDLDAIILSSPEEDLNLRYTSSCWQRFVYTFERLIASFSADYTMLSTAPDEAQAVNLWINWGRDQAVVLNSLVKRFTAQTGIPVNIKLTSASVIEGLLSGNTPDCLLMSGALDFAMRGILYDLSTFSDFEEVLEQFVPDAERPFRYKDGVYGLPDSLNFMVMFVRSDVFQELGLEVPNTWEEFLQCSSIIMRNNMSVGLPNLFTTYLYQYGGTLYNETLTRTALRSEQAMSAFDFTISLFKTYKFPVNYDFYNRFRTGEMPMGIADYSLCTQLLATAPEINGLWNMHVMPGFVAQDGTIDNRVTGSGSAAIMLKNCRNPLNCWSFLKWWVSEETQYQYATDVESALGVTARYTTSNIKALSRLAWSDRDLEVLLEQASRLIILPDAPGSYYLSRALNNAFYSAVYEGELPRNMLYKWAKTVDEEMARKQEEYADF